MRIAMALGTSAVVAACTAGSALADGPHTFSGACSFQGLAVQADQPLGRGGAAAFEPNALNVAGPGNCTGTLDGNALTEAASVLQFRVAGDKAGCLGTVQPLTGDGVLQTGGVQLPFAASFSASTLPLVPGRDGMTSALSTHIDMRGTQSGAASGDGDIDLASSALGKPIEQGGLTCQNGDLQHLHIDQPFATSSPLVSGPPPATPTAAPKVCASRRSFSVHVRSPRRGRISRVVATSGGKRLAVTKTAGRYVVRVSLGGKPKSVARIRITVTTTTGHRYSDSRTYHPCS